MAQEGYGEDAHHLGEIGEALIRVIQHHMMACPRHFALNPPTVIRRYRDGYRGEHHGMVRAAVLEEVIDVRVESRCERDCPRSSR